MAKPSPGAEGPNGPGTRPESQAAGIGRQAVGREDTQAQQQDAVRHHPVVLEQQARRAANAQLRIADWITAFAGSMNFVYLHIALFTVWMLFIESKPWPTLTLI